MSEVLSGQAGKVRLYKTESTWFDWGTVCIYVSTEQPVSGSVGGFGRHRLCHCERDMQVDEQSKSECGKLQSHMVSSFDRVSKGSVKGWGSRSGLLQLTTTCATSYARCPHDLFASL
eukprot:1699098-Amphidinium_carterae.2